MNMIKHYNVFIQFNATEMIWNRPSTSLYYVPSPFNSMQPLWVLPNKGFLSRL
jgi:hypothetical protein